MIPQSINAAASSFTIRPYRPAHLCKLYGICRVTFLKWIKPFEAEIGVRNGHFYNIKQVETIITRLGAPGKTMIDE